MDNDVTERKCPHCGSDRIEVLQVKGFDIVFEKTWPCTCDVNHSYSAVQTISEYKEEVSHFWLNDEGDLDPDDVEIIDVDSDPQDVDIECETCWPPESQQDSTVEQVSREEDPDKEQWTVRCKKCSTEMKFGWTQPDRAGQVVIVGVDDFRPDEVFPEPRFEEDWDN